MENGDELITRVQSLYNLQIERVTWHDSLYAARVAARLDTGEKTYKLKRYVGSKEQLTRLYQRHQVLGGLRPQCLPKWYETVKHHPFFVFGSELYYLTAWKNGRAFAHTPEDARALGETLAQVHLSLPIGGSFDRVRIDQRLRPITQAKQILQRRRFQQLPTQVQRFLQRESPSIQAALTSSAHALTKLETNLQPVCVHGDVTVPNVLFEDDNACLIDWERLNLGYGMEELARAAMNTCNLSVSLVDHLLEGYHLSRLSDQDQYAFRAFLQIPREVIYLLHKSTKNQTGEAVRVGWQLVMQTWRDRRQLLSLYSLSSA